MVNGITQPIRSYLISRASEPEPLQGNAIKLPSFAYDPSAPKNAAKAYQFAVDRPDLLSQVPCYCGCGQEVGVKHTSNLGCFIKQRNDDNLLFDRHASY